MLLVAAIVAAIVARRTVSLFPCIVTADAGVVTVRGSRERTEGARETTREIGSLLISGSA
jgi:hypothetical protein